MGRELKRKQAKKEGRPLKEKETVSKNTNPYEDIYKMLKTFGIILLIILVIYFLVALLITKEIDWFSKDEDTSESNVTSVTNSILARNTFMQSEEEYYVYYYDFNDENTKISILISNLSNVYKVDTSDAFNSNYVTDEELGNNLATNIDELKVINPTLIKISGDTIVEYYQTVDEIVNYLEK